MSPQGGHSCQQDTVQALYNRAFTADRHRCFIRKEERGEGLVVLGRRVGRMGGEGGTGGEEQLGEREIRENRYVSL